MRGSSPPTSGGIVQTFSLCYRDYFTLLAPIFKLPLELAWRPSLVSRRSGTFQVPRKDRDLAFVQGDKCGVSRPDTV